MADQAKSAKEELEAMQSEMEGLDSLAQVAGVEIPAEEEKPEKVAEENPAPDENTETKIEQVEQEESAPAPDENAEHQISEELVMAARARGFSDAEIQNFASSENLDAALAAIDRRFSAFGHDAMKAQQPPVNAAAAPKPQAEKPVPAPQQVAEDAEVDIPTAEIKLPAGFEEDYPEVVETLRAMNKTLSAQRDVILRLETDVRRPFRERLEREQSAANARAFQEVDRVVASEVDKPFHSFIGDGPLSKMKQDSPEWNARIEIMKEMSALAYGYQQHNIPTTMEYLFRRAAHAVLGDKIKETAVTEAEEKIKTRRRSFSARPGNRPSGNNAVLPAKSEEATEDEALLAASGLPD